MELESKIGSGHINTIEYQFADGNTMKAIVNREVDSISVWYGDDPAAPDATYSMGDFEVFAFENLVSFVVVFDRAIAEAQDEVKDNANDFLDKPF